VNLNNLWFGMDLYIFFKDGKGHNCVALCRCPMRLVSGSMHMGIITEGKGSTPYLMMDSE